MINLIKQSATECGIGTVLTNSEKSIETQLNTLTLAGDIPIMLISWDIDTSLNFDVNGFLENPDSKITALLMTKATDLTKVSMEDASIEMGALFQIFIQNLYLKLIEFQKSNNPPITNVSYLLVPKHGSGKHSGVLCKWNMKTTISVC
jgi:hypothetical protein